MSRFRELVAECARDELEQTQDMPGRTIAGEYHTNGVFRIRRDTGYPCHVYAPELSMEQHR